MPTGYSKVATHKINTLSTLSALNVWNLKKTIKHITWNPNTV